MMSDDDGFKLETKNLDGLIKALKANQGRVRVGIFGDKDARSTGDAKSNATIGKKHEFGEGKMPARSFLRMPLSTHLNAAVESSNAFSKQELENVVKQGSLEAWLIKLGVVGVKVVTDAFDKCGFGQWAPSNMSKKKNHQTLVESGALLKSIEWDVK